MTRDSVFSRTPFASSSSLHRHPPCHPSISLDARLTGERVCVCRIQWSGLGGTCRGKDGESKVRLTDCLMCDCSSLTNPDSLSAFFFSYTTLSFMSNTIIFFSNIRLFKLRILRWNFENKSLIPRNISILTDNSKVKAWIYYISFKLWYRLLKPGRGHCQSP